MNSGNAPDRPPRQIVVYRKYLHLQAISAQRLAGSLAGKLLLNIGFDQEGAELALAATIAGGAFLALDADPQILKSAVRNGSCDFMVNTLDEALRVLKNELRKRTPLSVGLLGDSGEILSAMIERGVQPDLLAKGSASETLRPAFDRMVQRGAQALPLTKHAAANEITWTAANPQDLRRMDKIALDLLPQQDYIRRRWLEQAAGSFYRQLPLERIVGMQPDERETFLQALKQAATRSPFHPSAELRWQDPAGAERTISLRSG